MKHKTFPGYITRQNIANNGIFVFGSNTEGRHGLGNAKVAQTNFGAIYGKASGIQGRSYGLITTDLASKRRGERYPHMAEEIAKFYQYAETHKESLFYLAYTDKGPFLSGFTFDELLDFFSVNGIDNIPDNIVFHEGFYRAMIKRRSTTVNNLVNMAKQEPWVRSFIDKFKGNLYLVGGAIRNYELNVPIKDLDYVATNTTVEQIEEFFHTEYPKIQVQLVGEHFKVFKITTRDDTYDLALARTETSTGSGHADFKIETNNVTIEEDLKRRDFTFNALALDLEAETVIDPYGGLRDLRDGILRCVDKCEITFKEDPLRLIRALRFMTIYGLSYRRHPESEHHNYLLSFDKSLINTISTERILEELRKIPISNYSRVRALVGDYDFFKEWEFQSDTPKVDLIRPFVLMDFSQLLLELLNYNVKDSVYSSMPGLTTEEKRTVKVHATLTDLLITKQINDQAIHLLEHYPEARFNPYYFCLHIYSLPIKKEVALTGNDLIVNLGLDAGKQIGDIILSLQKAIAKKEVLNEKQALLDYASALIKKN